ncbi:hypothetical protein EMGR_004656 [Emarellia grisea]
MHLFPSISAKILSALESTPYACTELIPLSGGYVNFVYRGILVSALPTTPPTAQVIVKHAEPYVAANSDWKSSVTRSYYEALMLRAMKDLPATKFINVTTTSPILYEYHTESHTAIFSDLPESSQLQVYLSTHELDEADVFKIGVSLGRWMRNFHEWSATLDQSSLREEIRAIFEGSIEVFRRLQQRLKTEVVASEDQLIHGDFGCRNVLLSNGPLSAEFCPLDLRVIDWELSQLGSIAVDLGQMFAELYALSHFHSVTAASAMISSFMAGYGSLRDELAFRVALEFGMHLSLWPCREPANNGDQLVKRCVCLGKDMIVHAEEKDKLWFRSGILDSIFDFEEPRRFQTPDDL